MSDEAVKASANFQDALDTLGRTATGLKNKLGAELLPSLTQGMEGLTDILAGNVEQGAEKINAAISELIGNILPKLVELIQGMLPSISTAISSIMNGILKILPTLVSSVTGFLLNDFIPAILNMLPEIINSGLELIFALAEGIAQALPSLIPQIIDVVIRFTDTGIPFDPNEISLPATGNANGAGIYDMSGNVLEFCWDWFEDYTTDNIYGAELGFERVSRGGSWSEYTMFLYAGDRYSYDPNECYNYMGFRICCSVDR